VKAFAEVIEMSDYRRKRGPWHRPDGKDCAHAGTCISGLPGLFGKRSLDRVGIDSIRRGTPLQAITRHDIRGRKQPMIAAMEA
jgi:hypothetical protein